MSTGTTEDNRPVGGGAAQPVYEIGLTKPLPTGARTNAGAAHTATGQVTASISAGTLIAPRATRRRVSFLNIDPGITVWVGGATVTNANGYKLIPGASKDFETIDLIQVIADSGSPIICYAEEYD